VRLGQRLEVPVRQGPEKMEVAEDGKTRRGRRKPLAAIAAGCKKLLLPLGGEEDEDGEEWHQQSEEREEERRVPDSKECRDIHGCVV
jgi:hypothetical protein